MLSERAIDSNSSIELQYLIELYDKSSKENRKKYVLTNLTDLC